MKIANTAKDLKKLLETVPDETVIILDGCDCEEAWGGRAKFHSLDKRLVLVRQDHGDVRVVEQDNN